MNPAADMALCVGTTHAACQSCLRRHRLHEHTGERVWIEPPIDMLSGECRFAVGPVIRLAAGTAVEAAE